MDDHEAIDPVQVRKAGIDNAVSRSRERRLSFALGGERSL